MTEFEIYKWFMDCVNTLSTDLTGGNSDTGMVTAAILVGVGYLARSIPAKIIAFIISKSTVLIQAENSWQSVRRDLFMNMSEFIALNQSKRDFRITDAKIVHKASKLKLMFGLVEGSGILFHGFRPYHYRMTEAREQGAVPQMVFLRTFGRDPQKVFDRMGIDAKVMADHSTRNFYERKAAEWQSVGTITKAAPIFLPPDTKKLLDDKIDFFMNNRDWYLDRGISHKLLIILEGAPGTGKSRIARYVADRLNYSLGTILTPGSLTTSCRLACKENIVVSIPDVDAVGIGKARIGMRGSIDTKDKKKEDTPKDSKDVKEPTVSEDAVLAALMTDDTILAEALNLFQGDIPVNNLVCVMSTNCIADLDSAMLRPSRCDLALTIGNLSYDELNDFYKHSYEVTGDIGEEFKDISIRACDMANAFTSNAFDKEAFKADIRTL